MCIVICLGHLALGQCRGGPEKPEPGDKETCEEVLPIGQVADDGGWNEEW